MPWQFAFTDAAAGQFRRGLTLSAGEQTVVTVVVHEPAAEQTQPLAELSKFRRCTTHDRLEQLSLLGVAVAGGVRNSVQHDKSASP